MKDTFITLLGLLLILLFSYFFCALFVVLIFNCFELVFTWKFYTGIWLSIVLVSSVFYGVKNE